MSLANRCMPFKNTHYNSSVYQPALKNFQLLYLKSACGVVGGVNKLKNYISIKCRIFSL